MSGIDPRIVDALMDQVRLALGECERSPVVIGLCGAQGSGKTTLAAALSDVCRRNGLRCAVLSIDDLYLTRAERQDLARRVHPLFATRGVPGTHDVPMGLSVIASLKRGEACPLPRFDKGTDDRRPHERWPRAPSHCDVLVLEGWCVGARPQEPTALTEPVNALEQKEDPQAIWRTHANAALAGPYSQLFGTIDRLILLAAPDFPVVEKWRLQQEQDLASRGGPEIMDGWAIARFVSHYERLTRYILEEMPHRADLVVQLDAERRPVSITPGG